MIIIGIKQLWTNTNGETKRKDILLLILISIYPKLSKIERKSAFLNKFSIPYSSYYVMRNNSQKYTNKDNNQADGIKTSNKIDSSILEVIKNYISPPQHPISLEKIRQHVNNKIGISINKREIKQILKESLNYSYKKGSSGSIILKSSNHKAQKWVFSSRILLSIFNEKLIINIDEIPF